MGKMSFRLHQALKSTLQRISQACPNGVLVYGYNHLTQEQFCKPVKLIVAAKRLLSCTRIEIRGLSYYVDVERKFVNWIKSHVKLTRQISFCHLESPHNWLRYNISNNLSCLKLGVGKIDYYLILREEWLLDFRNNAFNK